MDEELPTAEDVRGILKNTKTVEDPTPPEATAALIPSVGPAPPEWERGLEPRSIQRCPPARQVDAREPHVQRLRNPAGCFEHDAART